MGILDQHLLDQDEPDLEGAYSSGKINKFIGTDKEQDKEPGVMELGLELAPETEMPVIQKRAEPEESPTDIVGDAYQAELERKEKLRLEDNFNLGMEQPPGQAEKNRKLSEQLFRPLETIEADIEEARRVLRAKNYADLLETNPKSKKHILESEDPGSLSWFVPTLNYFETLSEDASRGYTKGDLIYQMGRLGTDHNLVKDPELQKELLDLALEIHEELKTIPESEGHFGGVGIVGATSEQIGMQLNFIHRILGTGAAAGTVNALAGLLAGPGAVAASPLLFGTGFIGGAAAGAVWETSVIEEGAAFVGYVAEGIDKKTASEISKIVGGVAGVLEVTGAVGWTKPLKDMVLKRFKKEVMVGLKDKTKREATKNILKTIGRMLAFEVSTEVAQQWVEMIGREVGRAKTPGMEPRYKQDDFLGEVWDETLHIMDKTLKATLGLTSPITTIKTYTELKSVTDSKNAQKVLEQMGELGQAEAFDNMGPKEQEAIKAATENGPVETVYVKADKFQEYFQDGTDTVAEELGIADQLEDKEKLIERGGSLEIPIGVYAAKIARDADAHIFLEKHSTFNPLDPTPQELENFVKDQPNLDDIRVKNAENYLEQVQEDTEITDSAQAVFDETRNLNIETGKVPIDQATQWATLNEAFFVRQAAEESKGRGEKVLPYELWTRYKYKHDILTKKFEISADKRGIAINDEDFADLKAQGYDSFLIKADKELAKTDPDFAKDRTLSFRRFELLREKQEEGVVAPTGQVLDQAALAETLMESTEFRQKMEGSQVVDGRGIPIEVYHATGIDFQTFLTNPEQQFGAHFGTAEQAGDILKNKDEEEMPEGERIMPVYLNLKNPLRANDAGDWGAYFWVLNAIVDRVGHGLSGKAIKKLEEIGNEYADTREKYQHQALPEIRAVLEEEGFDGIVYENRMEGISLDEKLAGSIGEDSYIAFHPEQIIPAYVLQPEQTGQIQLEVTPTGGKNNNIILNWDIAEAFTKRHMDIHGRVLDPINNKEDYQYVLGELDKEFKDQANQAKTGEGWYTEDIKTAIRLTSLLIPELKTSKDKRDIFLTMAALMSIRQKPGPNWDIAIMAMQGYLKTGKIPKKKSKYVNWGLGAIRSNLQMFQMLIDEHGERGAIKWLRANHTGKELAEFRRDSKLFVKKKRLSGYLGEETNLTKTYPGIAMMGAKVSEFFQNATGFDQNAVTIDVWASRTYNRHIGRLLDVGKAEKSNKKIVGDVRGISERGIIKQLFRDIAKSNNVAASTVQASLWYFEQRLFRNHGAKADTGTFEAAARGALSARKIVLPARGRPARGAGEIPGQPGKRKPVPIPKEEKLKQEQETISGHWNKSVLAEQIHLLSESKARPKTAQEWLQVIKKLPKVTQKEITYSTIDNFLNLNTKENLIERQKDLIETTVVAAKRNGREEAVAVKAALEKMHKDLEHMKSKKTHLISRDDIIKHLEDNYFAIKEFTSGYHAVREFGPESRLTGETTEHDPEAVINERTEQIFQSQLTANVRRIAQNVADSMIEDELEYQRKPITDTHKASILGRAADWWQSESSYKAAVAGLTRKLEEGQEEIHSVGQGPGITSPGITPAEETEMLRDHDQWTIDLFRIRMDSIRYVLGKDISKNESIALALIEDAFWYNGTTRGGSEILTPFHQSRLEDITRSEPLSLDEVQEQPPFWNMGARMSVREAYNFLANIETKGNLDYSPIGRNEILKMNVNHWAGYETLEEFLETADENSAHNYSYDVIATNLIMRDDVFDGIVEREDVQSEATEQVGNDLALWNEYQDQAREEYEGGRAVNDDTRWGSYTLDPNIGIPSRRYTELRITWQQFNDFFDKLPPKAVAIRNKIISFLQEHGEVNEEGRFIPAGPLLPDRPIYPDDWTTKILMAMGLATFEADRLLVPGDFTQEMSELLTKEEKQYYNEFRDVYFEGPLLAGNEVFKPFKRPLQFRAEGHFPELSIIVHTRFNVRGNVLVIEEMQGDWGQKLRKWKKVQRLKEEESISGRDNMTDEEKSFLSNHYETDRPPPGPFIGETKDWTELALKRIISIALEQGYDRVEWTSGMQQADRWSVSQHFSGVAWDPKVKTLYGRRPIPAGYVGDYEPMAYNVEAEDLAKHIGGTLGARILQGETKKSLEVKSKAMRKEREAVQVKVVDTRDSLMKLHPWWSLKLDKKLGKLRKKARKYEELAKVGKIDEANKVALTPEEVATLKKHRESYKENPLYGQILSPSGTPGSIGGQNIQPEDIIKVEKFMQEDTTGREIPIHPSVAQSFRITYKKYPIVGPDHGQRTGIAGRTTDRTAEPTEETFELEGIWEDFELPSTAAEFKKEFKVYSELLKTLERAQDQLAQFTKAEHRFAVRGDLSNDALVLAGEELIVADKGFGSYYDEILPNVARGVLKDMGVKNADMNLGHLFELKPKEYSPGQQPGFDVAPIRQEMVDSEGRTKRMALFQKGRTKQGLEERGSFLAGAPFQGKGVADEITTITSLEGANLSTFLHETGHYYFEVMRDMASQPWATQQIKDDMKTLLDFSGAPDLTTWNNMSIGERRTSHEKIARAFELYLYEGKAPSLELKQLFRRFKDWLTHVYKSMKRLNVTLTDDVRDVFDRMLASDEQIKTAQQVGNYEALFKNEEESGVDPARFAAYQERLAEGNDEAREKLQAKSLQNLKWLEGAKSIVRRRLQREQRGRREDVKAEMLDIYSKQPVYQAITWLRQPTETKVKRKTDTKNVVPEVDSLFTAIAKLGGIKKQDLEDEWGIDPKQKFPGFSPVARAKGAGLTIDEMGIQLAQKGIEYLELDEHGKFDKHDFETRFMEELAGRKKVSKLNEQYNAAEDLEDAYFKYATGEGGAKVTLESRAKLSAPALRQMYGELEGVGWKRLPTGKWGLVSETGIDPQLVAELFGFNTGEELMRAIFAARPLEEVVMEATDQRMLELYGNMNTPEQLEEAVLEAVHDENRTNAVHTELTFLIGTSGGRNIQAKDARSWAERKVAGTNIRDLKPAKYLAQERKASKMALEALRKGNREEAIGHQQAVIINHHFARAMQKAKDESERMIRYFNKFNNKTTRKAIEPEFLEQIDALLEQYDFRVSVTESQLRERKHILTWVAEQKELGIIPVIPDKILLDAQKKHYRDVKFEALRGLKDAVKNIDWIGRWHNKLRLAKEKQDLEDVVEELVFNIEKFAPEQKVDLRVSHKLPQDKTPSAIEQWIAIHRKFANNVWVMDGFKYGPFWEAIVRPMNERASWETDEVQEVTKRLAELFDIYSPIEFAARWFPGDQFQRPFSTSLSSESISGKDRLYTRVFFESIGQELSRMERIMIAMNWFNETNRIRMTIGHGWSEEQVQEILETLDERDWAFVTGVLELIHSFWPQMQAKQKRIHGITPEGVQGIPVETEKFGVLNVDGAFGYFPIMEDEDLSLKAFADRQKDALEQARKGVVGQATTRRGHLEERSKAEFGAQVRLDFGAITQHLNQVIHDLAWHEWLIDANKLLGHPTLAGTIQKYHGIATATQMIKMLNDIAIGDIPAILIHEKMSNYLRSGVSIAYMAWNLGTAYLQPFGITQGFQRVGFKWISQGIKEFSQGAVKMEGIAKKVNEHVGMKHRGITMNRELNDLMNRIGMKGFASKLTAPAKDTYFYMIQKMQSVVDIPIFLGAKERYLTEGKDEQTAEAMAYQQVIDTQGSGHIKDMAQIQRGHPFGKIWTNFISFFQVTFQLYVDSLAREGITGPWSFFREVKKSPIKLGRLAVDFWLLTTLPVVAMYYLKDAWLKGECDYGRDLVCSAKKMGADHIAYLTSGMIGFREFTGAAYGFTDWEGPAGTRFYAESLSFTRQILDGEAKMADIKAANRAGGILFHYPSGQIEKTFFGYMDYMEGKTQNPAAPLFGYSKNR